MIHDPAPSQTTTDLLRRAVGGQREAWEQLVRRFEPAVATLIRGYRLQEADALDAAQRTWLMMFENGHRIREPEALVGWLRTTARRECLRIIRDTGRAEPLADTEAACGADPTGDVEQHVVDSDTARRLGVLVHSLPPRSRLLIQFLFTDDPSSYAELSGRTGIPVGSIGPTRARALQRLRHLFERGPEDQPGPASRCERRSTALA